MEKKPTTRQKSKRTLQSDRSGKGPIGKRDIKTHNTSGKQKRGDKRMNPSSH